VLNEVPLVSTAINAWANLTRLSDNVTAQIVYNGWTGNGVRVLIVATISVIVLRALLLRIQQWSHQVAMAHAIESGAASPESVKKRLVRVPTTLQSPDDLRARASRHVGAAAGARGDGEAGVPRPRFPGSLDRQIERDLGLAHIREALATMSSSAREKVAVDLGPIIERQMMTIRDAVDMQTKKRLEEIRSILKRA
jgi:hypothetical protein